MGLLIFRALTSSDGEKSASLLSVAFWGDVMASAHPMLPPSACCGSRRSSHVWLLLQPASTFEAEVPLLRRTVELELLSVHVVLSIALIGHMISIILPIQMTVEFLVPCRVDVE